MKSKYNLKNHLATNKKCLKLRGLEMDSNFICKGCNSSFANKTNMIIHTDICKKYIILKVKEEYEKKFETVKEEYEKKFETTKEEYEKKFETTKEEYEKKIKLQETTMNDEHNEKMISKLEIKISQCDTFIQTLAREGSNKPTTTNNTINNTVKNQLSSTFTLDKLEPKKLEETMREHYTEMDFFGGQKRLANFFLEKVIKTPDDKMLICCTDTSRNKFKILDLRGNLKEDIEARSLCEKLKVPTQIVTKEIYDKVIVRIDRERDRLSSDDRSRREKLLDDTMRAQRFYMDNLNFDDLNYNQDFMHELRVLLNV